MIGFARPYIRWAVVRRNVLSGISRAARNATLPVRSFVTTTSDLLSLTLKQYAQFSTMHEES